MARVVILGAGPMGLAAAYHAARAGHDVDVVEADAVAGGMAAHFDFAGVSIERFYHFVCKADAPTFALMEELGIGDRMRWVPTSMGYYTGGRIHPWGDPLSLLRFPHLGLIDKLRTGAQMFLTTRAKSFDGIEHLTARQWIERGSGKRVYERLWRRLMELKFHELSDEVSASWIATRVKRVGTSRRSIFQEELGYIEGGTQTLVDALLEAIAALGGRVHLSHRAQQVRTKAGKVTGVMAGGREFVADAVISTVPTPHVPDLVPDLPEDLKEAYRSIRNIGVVCLLMEMRRSVSPHFWLNIIDDRLEVPGIIEFSNLRPLGKTMVYVPYYMPRSHPKWGWSDAQFIAEAQEVIRTVNPRITEDDFLETAVGRLTYAQPVCEPNFRDRLPAIVTPIAGLQIADTCYYYPEDRGVSESARLGRQMALRIDGGTRTR